MIATILDSSSNTRIRYSIVVSLRFKGFGRRGKCFAESCGDVVHRWILLRSFLEKPASCLGKASPYR